jgi:hypothetical protein
MTLLTLVRRRSLVRVALLVTMLFFWSAVETTKLDADAHGGFVSPLRFFFLFVVVAAFSFECVVANKTDRYLSLCTQTRASQLDVCIVCREKEQNA